MPIIDVEVVRDADESVRPTLARELADGAGEVLGAPEGQTWVRLRMLPREHYAENGGSPSEDVRPVFATVLKARWPDLKDMKREISRLTEVFAKICGRPAENVHVLYLPEAAGRISFGGKLVGA